MVKINPMMVITGSKRLLAFLLIRSTMSSMIRKTIRQISGKIPLKSEAIFCNDVYKEYRIVGNSDTNLRGFVEIQFTVWNLYSQK